MPAFMGSMRVVPYPYASAVHFEHTLTASNMLRPSMERYVKRAVLQSVDVIAIHKIESVEADCLQTGGTLSV
jgi:hypothetical protein